MMCIRVLALPAPCAIDTHTPLTYACYMRLGSPFEALHQAIAAAVHRDLPDIQYETRDWAAWQKLTKTEQDAAIKNRTTPNIAKVRRPESDEIEIVMFPQTWGSTALGYGGIGGSAMTPGYTIIITYHNHICVYFGCGRLAYKLDLSKMSPEGRDRYTRDVAAQNMASIRESERYK